MLFVFLSKFLVDAASSMDPGHWAKSGLSYTLKCDEMCRTDALNYPTTFSY